MKTWDNCYLYPLYWRGNVYASAAHAILASRTLDPIARDKIMRAETVEEAMSIAMEAPVRPDWRNIKGERILEILRSKFYYNIEFRKILVQEKNPPRQLEKIREELIALNWLESELVKDLKASFEN